MQPGIRITGFMALMVLLVSCSAKSGKTTLSFDGTISETFLDTMTVQANSTRLELLEMAIFEETNLQRTQLGFPPFKFESRLQEAARLHSQEMAQLHYFDHKSPVSENRTIRKRLQHMGIRNGYGGENIAIHPLNKKLRVVFNPYPVDSNTSRYLWRNKGKPYTYREFAQELVERWMNSVPHRRNILSPYFQFLGVGCKQGKYEDNPVFYVTQDFSSTNY